MKYNLVFISVCLVLDYIISVIFGVDYSYVSAFWIPTLAYCAMLLCADKDNIFASLIVAFCLGFIQDIGVGGFMFLNSFIYIITTIVFLYWSNNLSETLMERVLLLMVMIFAKEVLIYGYMLFNDITSLSLENFLVKRLFFTMIFSFFSCLLTVKMADIRRNYIFRNREYQKQHETFFGHQFK